MLFSVLVRIISQEDQKFCHLQRFSIGITLGDRRGKQGPNDSIIMVVAKMFAKRDHPFSNVRRGIVVGLVFCAGLCFNKPREVSKFGHRQPTIQYQQLFFFLGITTNQRFCSADRRYRGFDTGEREKDFFLVFHERYHTKRRLGDPLVVIV